MSVNQSRTVFITGANGFIGANLIKLLLRKDYDVHALVRKNANLWRIKDIAKKIKIHKADICDAEKLKKILISINPDYIFHLASYGNSADDTDLNEMISVNIVGLKNLLDATKNINYQKLIVTGTSSEYGFKTKPMEETDSLKPNSYYSATKGAATLIAQSFAMLNNKPIVIVRPFSVFGPYEEENRLVPIVIKLALANKEINLTSKTAKRDFIFVKDIATAFIKIANNNLKSGEIINLGTGKQSSNYDVVKIIEKILNKKLTVKIGTFPQKPWDTDYWVANTEKASKILHWKPKYTLEAGLKETIAFYKNRS